MLQNRFLFGSTIGIIGGGQLGRMMATAAKHMGYRIAVLDPTPDCPTAQVADHHIVAAYNDQAAVAKLAEQSDVITYEFENVDLAAAQFLEAKGLLPQGANSLAITQDREKEKAAMVASNQPVAPFVIVHNEPELFEAIANIGYPCVVKTCRGGYDGKGQVKLQTKEDLEAAVKLVEDNERVIVESWVPFDREISVVFTRFADGSISFFPIAENTHRDHILYMTQAPATISMHLANQAKQAAKAIAETIGVIGTFAIEIFVQGDHLYINELAPRPHNSGHYTIEACNVSQFEQHIRAICGLAPLPVYFHGAAIMVNLLGQDIEPYLAEMDRLPGHFHMYGKAENKPKRKMGHVTYIGENIKALNQTLEVNNQINM
ncbi:5-(carboxyamino)imidazole ribonucleotide synthase [Paraliobacillus ryukyuensis]|uniref:5-(carboxyamino)imidazole ribonucleotide synthase n=1 Tax=Paraliobacillus ryukyuensis TaxID=200904 RepID=UPI0009A5A5CE|nr:5-(carboxyamino)imidazole ribonucleotide synthase [Paraliobacillus ryukyuensis]